MDNIEEKTQKFIIKYFTEIMIKGEIAKKQMLSQVYNNVKTILSKNFSNIKIKKFFDKIEIFCSIKDANNVKSKLLNTPGIEQVLEVVQINNMTSLDLIKIKINDLMGHLIVNKTFAIKAKRVGAQDFKSPDIEKTVGGYMLAMNQTKGVNLKNPEVLISLELEHATLNIVNKRHIGLGGFPIGTQNSILSLMSGGFDSTVASYLAIKRGIKTHFIFFNLGGLAHELGVKQVAYFIWNKFQSSHRVSFISVPFEEVVSQIFKDISKPYMGIVLKKLMLMVSEKIANDLKIDALLTGESVAQVSSQTLRNLALIDENINKLVLRPLCMMNKPDIIDIAHKIGTKKFAESMPEYCGVISKNPVIKGSYERAFSESKSFDYSVLNKAIKNASFVNVDEISQNVDEIGQMEIIKELNNENFVVIDIRQADECIKTSVETLKIPFYNLKKEFIKLPQDKIYLFYCDKGILSQLHGQYLRDAEGFTNIKVYRP